MDKVTTLLVPTRASRLRSRCLLLLVILLVVGAVPGAAQNLLANGDFASSLAGWPLREPASGASESWSAVDADVSPSSGSALIRNERPAGNDGAAAIQCVAVEGGVSYTLSAAALIPAGQGRSGRALIGTTWWMTPDCLGVAVGSDPDQHFLQVTAAGHWASGTDTKRSPAAARGVEVRLVTFKNEPGGALRAHFDNVGLCRTGSCGDEGWITSSQFPNHRFRVTVGPSSAAPFFGAEVADCIPGAVCVSGALAGRAEVLLRLIGPRSNGYLWLQAVRFTPSELEIEVEQSSTRVVRTYRLDAIPPDEDTLDGLVDRTAFLP